MRRYVTIVMLASLCCLLAAEAAASGTVELGPRRASAIRASAEAGSVRALLVFDLPDRVTTGEVVVESALLCFEAELTAGEYGQIEVYPLTAAWSDAGAVSWSEPWRTAGGDFDGDVAGGVVPIRSAGGVVAVRSDVTRIVRLWANGVIENRGFIVMISEADRTRTEAALGIGADDARLRIVYTRIE